MKEDILPGQFFSVPGGVIQTRLDSFRPTECSHDRETILYRVFQVLSQLIWKETIKRNSCAQLWEPSRCSVFLE